MEAHSPPLSLETTNRSSVLVTIAGLILFTFKIPDFIRDNGFRCGRFNNPNPQPIWPWSVVLVSPVTSPAPATV